jgi:ABC-type transporter Mla maintaining outer membrane lipid asymmetry ATPase subunit MlaF
VNVRTQLARELHRELIEDPSRPQPRPGLHAVAEAESAPSAAPAAIEFRGLHTHLGENWVLRGVSFTVPAGRITALIGSSGVGKTTTIGHLLLRRPTVGEVLVEGRSVWEMKDAERRRMLGRFGVVLQGSGVYGSALWDSMTVMQNLLHQMQTLRPELDEEEQYRRGIAWLRDLGLAEHMADPPSILSAGQKKRVALARALVCDPEFAILDSFDMGIDGVRLAGVRKILRRHHLEHQGTYLIATHNMELVRDLAHHVVVLSEGHVVAEGPAEEVLASDHPFVAQLIEGSPQGPLGMESGFDIPEPPPRRDQVDIHEEWVQAPGVMVFLLACLTGGALFLGSGSAWEIGGIIAIWLLCGLFVAWYYRNERRGWR